MYVTYIFFSPIYVYKEVIDALDLCLLSPGSSILRLNLKNCWKQKVEYDYKIGEINRGFFVVLLFWELYKCLINDIRTVMDMYKRIH